MWHVKRWPTTVFLSWVKSPGGITQPSQSLSVSSVKPCLKKRVNVTITHYSIFSIFSPFAMMPPLSVIYCRPTLLLFSFFSQGILIFLMFDLRPKIYYMFFEKVTGRPHPALRSVLWYGFDTPKLVKGWIRSRIQIISHSWFRFREIDWVQLCFRSISIVENTRHDVWISIHSLYQEKYYDLSHPNNWVVHSLQKGDFSI